MKRVKQQKLPRNLLVLNPLMRKGAAHRKSPKATDSATMRELRDFK